MSRDLAERSRSKWAQIQMNRCEMNISLSGYKDAIRGNIAH